MIIVRLNATLRFDVKRRNLLFFFISEWNTSVTLLLSSAGSTKWLIPSFSSLPNRSLVFSVNMGFFHFARTSPNICQVQTSGLMIMSEWPGHYSKLDYGIRNIAFRVSHRVNPLSRLRPFAQHNNIMFNYFARFNTDNRRGAVVVG